MGFNCVKSRNAFHIIGDSGYNIILSPRYAEELRDHHDLSFRKVVAKVCQFLVCNFFLQKKIRLRYADNSAMSSRNSMHVLKVLNHSTWSVLTIKSFKMPSG